MSVAIISRKAKKQNKTLKSTFCFVCNLVLNMYLRLTHTLHFIFSDFYCILQFSPLDIKYFRYGQTVPFSVFQGIGTGEGDA